MQRNNEASRGLASARTKDAMSTRIGSFMYMHDVKIQSNQTMREFIQWFTLKVINNTLLNNKI